MIPLRQLEQVARLCAKGAKALIGREGVCTRFRDSRFSHGKRRCGLQIIVLWILSMLNLFSNAAANDQPISVSASLICDKCAMLNALSDDRKFNAGFESERSMWLSRLSEVGAGQAVRVCAGKGIPLAYFLNGSDDSGEKLVRDFNSWRSGLKRFNIEPAYLGELEFIDSHRSSFSSYFNALTRSGFDEWWHDKIRPESQEKAKKFETVLGNKINPQTVKLVNLFVGDSASPLDYSQLPPCFVGHFNGPYNFNLLGGAACFKEQLDPDEAPCVLIHEWLHGFNPSKHPKTFVQNLRKIPFYDDAFNRIYINGKEGLEEEFIVAAELYICEKKHLLSTKAALRRIKNDYGGMPLAGVLYQRLSNVYPQNLPADFNFSRFLDETLNAHEFGERLQTSFEKVTKPISGRAGMKLTKENSNFIVENLAPHSAASKANLQVGDCIVSINGLSAAGKSLDAVVDQISGQPGDNFTLLINHEGQSKEVVLELQ